MFQGPFLQINIQDGAWRSRVKRTTSRVCSEEFDPDVTQCCKWPLKIDFAEFGWDWVLSPETYDADFCAGDCSLGEIICVYFICLPFFHQEMLSSLLMPTLSRCRALACTAPPAPAAPPGRCPPSTCSTLTPTRT